MYSESEGGRLALELKVIVRRAAVADRRRRITGAVSSKVGVLRELSRELSLDMRR